MAKVLIVLDAKFPFDIRVDKEISALAPWHEITLACAKDSNHDFNPEGYKIERILPTTDKKTKLAQELFTGLFFWDPLIERALKKHLKENRYDVIHVHDLPAFKTVFKLRGKAKVILDLHENYPEASQIWHQWRKSKLIRIKNQIIHSLNRWKRFEAYAVHKADMVIAVVEEMKTKLCREHGVSPAKVEVITNAETKDFILKIDASNTSRADLINNGLMTENAFNLHYIGGIGPHRGLDDAIKGLALYHQQAHAKPAILHIVGGGHPDNIAHLRNVAQSHHASAWVRFHQPVPFSEVAALMKYTDLNIIPHKSNGHCNHTIPHKLFQCMMTGTPLLVSSSPPLERHIRPSNSGSVFESDNPTSFMQTLDRIISNYDAAKAKAELAKQILAKNKWYWDDCAERLVKIYEQL